MDKRISELRERLYKKKAEARQKENLPVRRNTPPLLGFSCPSALGESLCFESVQAYRMFKGTMFMGTCRQWILKC